MVQAGQVLYSRSEDGARPVHVQEDESGQRTFRLGEGTYRTKQALLAELTGHPTGRHWGFDRYFGLGRYSADAGRPGTTNVLELFSVGEIVLPRTGILAPTMVLSLEEDITVPEPVAVTATGVIVLPEPSAPLGIDLEKRGHEVAKLLFAGYGRRIRAAGYDEDDVLQYVYLGIMTRNQGKCPWDPEKSSFGHYVHMVCGCLLANYHRKQRTRQQYEQLGMTGYTDDGDWGTVDAGSSQEPADPTAAEAWAKMAEIGADLIGQVRDSGQVPEKDIQVVEAALPYLVQGRTRKETAKALGISPPTLSRALTLLRNHADTWRDSLAD